MPTLARGLAKARARSASPTGAAPEPTSLNIATPERPLDIARLRRVDLDPQTLEDNRIVIDEHSPATAAYKMLRTRVLQRMRRNDWKTIAVTGTRPGEGKSLTAINLSISLARDMGTSVVLADLDFRKPSIHNHLGIATRYGIGDFLRGAVALEDVAVCPSIERLGVLVNTRSFANSSEMLTSPQAANLVRRLRVGEGRIVVFDLPPVLATDDLLAFCPLVDAVLLVVSHGMTKHADMRAARDVLQKVPIVGTVLNRSAERIAPYYYYGTA